MPNRRLALVGTAIGPWICTQRIPEPILRIAGLVEGKVLVHMRDDHKAAQTHEVAENGEHPVPAAAWMCVELTHPSRSTICEIIAA